MYNLLVIFFRILKGRRISMELNYWQCMLTSAEILRARAVTLVGHLRVDA